MSDAMVEDPTMPAMASDAGEAAQPEAQGSPPTPAPAASTSELSTEGNQEASRASSLCQVCNENPSKYKCSRCYLPYCSVACSKKHRDNHPPDPEPVAQAPLPAPTSDQTAAASADAISVPDRSNPFHVLDTSDKLRTLFSKYPQLPDQLRRIHDATLPPKPAPGGIPASLMKGAPPKKDAWNHDVGIKNGKAALRRAKNAHGEEGEGVREYYELILHMMNQTTANEATAQYLQQRIAQEDTKLIETLLEQEKR